MALVQNTLANGLANMAPTSSEATAIQNFADAWDTYFQGASVAGVPCAGGTTSAAKSAMIGAMTGLSVTGAAAMQAGVTAYWGAITPSAATVWVVPPNTVPSATPPPGLGGLSALLLAVFASNAADPTKTISQAASAIAAVLHTNGGLGGIAVVQPPPVAPPVPTPIL
jgi:hypothetical protein